MKNFFAKFHLFMPLVIPVAIVIFILIAIDFNYRLARIEREIEHIDEEVDTASTGVKRILALGRNGLAQRGTSAAANAKLGSAASNFGKVQVENKEYDFGIISKKDGIVSANFTIGNIGKATLAIGDITTSCDCTTAKISDAGVMPGKNAVLTVNFDPNFHEEPAGRFSRSIFVPTNDPENEELEFIIFIEIKD